MASENITKVLYPNDEVAQGKILRLQQQFFFVSCSLQDIIRLHCLLERPLERFHETWAVQLNDTHPAIAVAELMRLLVDEHALAWDAAWDGHAEDASATRTTPCCPRRWRSGRSSCSAGCCRATSRSSTRSTAGSSTRSARASPATKAALARMSIIDEGGDGPCAWRTSRRSAATRSTASPRCTPGCSTETVLRDFYELWPEKFSNVTNGVTPRRFVAVSNPPLARLITERIGDGWLQDLDQLRASSRWPTTRSSGGSGARSSWTDKRAPGDAHRRAGRRRGGSRGAVRRPGQAPARIQAAAPERAAHPHALPAPEARPAGRRPAARRSSSAPRPPRAISWPSASSS